MIRNFFSTIFFLGALLSLLAGAALHWADHVASSPEPAQRIASAIAYDKTVAEVVATQIEDTLVEQLADVSDIPGLENLTAQLLQQGVASALADEQIDQAWRESINDTRRQLISDLHNYGKTTDQPPTIKVRFDPFIQLAWGGLATSNPQLQSVLGQIQPPTEAAVIVAELPAAQAALARDVLSLCSYWWAGYGLAALLGCCALVVGTRVARWVLLMLTSLVGAATVLALTFLTQGFTFTARSEMLTAMGGAVASQLKASLDSWLTGYLYGFLVGAVLGMLCAVTAVLRGQQS